jgi:hypothetical protein
MDQGAFVIYVVGGFMRSGTSMMMCCLEAGGLEAVYNAKRDKAGGERWSDDDYHPNEGGFYELTVEEYRAPGFAERCEGKAVKLLRRGPLRMPEGHQCRAAIMRRDSEEIRQSAQAIFSASLPRRYGDDANRMIDGVVAELETRPNWDVQEVRYRDVVEQPLQTFESLDWPIDPAAAASVVAPSLCRYRREELHVGV